MEENPDIPLVEMDTVEGEKGGEGPPHAALCPGGDDARLSPGS